MLKRTRGIVLNTVQLGEADLIATYFTYDFGLIKVFVKSPRKLKSRFGSSLEPLTYSKISFWGKEDANLPKLTQADIVESFKLVREKLDNFIIASEMAELAINFLPEREPNTKVFKLLCSALKNIEKNPAMPLSAILYKVRFLHLTGYAPRLNGCALCGRSELSFYMSHGSVVCERCLKGGDTPIKLSQGTVKLYESLSKWDVSIVHRIKPSKSLISELSNVINDHIRYTLSKPLKSGMFNPNQDYMSIKSGLCVKSR
jgi:DNA repair protein RecO (recombination protein O)